MQAIKDFFHTGHTHGLDAGGDGDHGGHGHSHAPLHSPGEFRHRPKPLARSDFHKRSFTIGIGGPVGTGCVRCTHTAR
jgi:urease accessory protein